MIEPTATPLDVINGMRTLSLHQIRRQLEVAKSLDDETKFEYDDFYRRFIDFLNEASLQPNK